MITPSFGLTATERVLPRLALDFTTASLDPRITFTRTGNTATVTNSSGLITPINADLPRFDFDPITLACKGLLVEEQRTNLLTHSENFADASWTKSDATVTSNTIIAPDGTLTGDKLVENVNNAFHTILKGITKPSVNPTITIYAKAAGRNWLYLAPFPASPNDFTNDSRAYFDVANGVVGTVTRGTASIIPVGDGWYRCSLTMSQMTSSLSLNLNFQAATATANGTVSYQGNGTSGVYIWGAQLEAASFASSYIPTVASAVTRNADVATMTGTNFSNWYNATQGASTIFAIPISISGIKPLFQMDDNTADNIINLRGNAANPELYIKATTDQAQIDAGTIVANTAYKLSGAWNTDNCAASQNGAAAVTDNTATIPTVTQARLGSDGTNYANAWLQKIFYYPQRLLNAEVQAFSK